MDRYNLGLRFYTTCDIEDMIREHNQMCKPPRYKKSFIRSIYRKIRWKIDKFMWRLRK